MEGIQSQLDAVTLEETAAQVGQQSTAGSLPPPVPHNSPRRSGVQGVEARQVNRIRRELQEMEEMYMTESPMTDFEKALAEYHALDLREISHAVHDLVIEADMALPTLSPMLDAEGSEDMEARVNSQLNPNAPVFVSSVVPVYRALRDLSKALENQVENQARLTGVGTYGSGLWFLRNSESYPENQGPPPSPMASNTPSNSRRNRQNRTARNQAARRRRKIRARLARERAWLES